MQSILSQYRGLSRDLYVLAIARAVSSAGSFILPMLALILTQKMGMSTAKSGVVIAAASMSYIPGSLIGGKLADHFGRKGVILVAEILAGLSWIACGFFPASIAVLPFIFIAYICMGAVNPTIGALVADVTQPEDRKTAYSLNYLGHNVGIAVGPLIAGFLFLNHANWMFWGDGITTLIAAVMILFFVTESKPDSDTEAHNEKEASVQGSVWPILWARPHLIWYTCISFLLVFCYAQLFFSLPLQLNEIFGDQGARNYGWVMTVNAVLVLLLTPAIIAYTKKMHAIFAVSLSGVFTAIGFGAIYWINSLWLFLFTTCIWTIGEILSATNSDVYIASHSPQSHRGRINSILPLVLGSGFTFSPLLMGQFIDSYGIRNVWLLVILLSSIGSFGLMLLGISERRREKME